MKDPHPEHTRFGDIMKIIFSTRDEDITCAECFDHIDEYVDMLRAGQEPEAVLPQVKSHLDQCSCCKHEFNALITILEAEDVPPGEGET